jgi:hypothetical protein
LAGGALAPGVVVEGAMEAEKAFKTTRNIQKRQKTGDFAHILAYKSPKTPFFAQKYLTKYTQKIFFEKSVNFQYHYISHCGVILV